MGVSLSVCVCVCVCVLCVCVCVFMWFMWFMRTQICYNNMGMTEVLQFEGGLCVPLPAVPVLQKCLKNILKWCFIENLKMQHRSPVRAEFRCRVRVGQ